MKIEVKQTIDVSDKLICSGSIQTCPSLIVVPNAEKHMVCAYFNRIVWWSDRAGFFVRCEDCVNAQREYLEEG